MSYEEAMRKTALPKDQMSDMMAALLYAMKGECDCISCKALAKSADAIISKAHWKQPARARKKVRT